MDAHDDRRPTDSQAWWPPDDPDPRAAIELLVDRYAAQAYAWAYDVVRDAQAAEECVQDAFVSVWELGEGIRRIERPGPWLYRAVTWRALNHLRGRRRRHRHEIPAELPEREAGDDPEDWTRRRLVAEAISRLPASDRMLLYYRYWFGLTDEEIAAEIGTKVGTVKSRLARIREALRRSGWLELARG